MEAPLVSVTTPTLNQDEFLRQAIDSVLAQTYPRIEYWVIDGGSNDATHEILRSYGDRLRWISEPDSGQSQAINKGFARSRGSIVAWLNSDDLYHPKAVERAVQLLESRPEVGLVYGRGALVDRGGETIRDFHEIEPFNLWRLLHFQDFILQPATFFRRGLVGKVGGLDESLHFGMDWDLWIKLSAVAEVAFLPQLLAYSREYEETKTSRGKWRRIRELGDIVKRHTGRRWTPGLRLYALDTLKRSLESGLPRVFAPLLDRLILNLWRGILRRAPVHSDGWLAPKAAFVFPSRWRTARLELEAVHLPPGLVQTVALTAQGQRLASRRIRSVGRVNVELELPVVESGAELVAESPFLELTFRSDYSFRPDPSSGDRRLLALRCHGIHRLS